MFKFQPHALQLDILRESDARWGKDHGIKMACEELAETITALCHFDRGRVPIEKVIDEFGDAIVCTSQVIYADTGDLQLVEMAIFRSFAKLRAKLSADNKNNGHDQ